MFILLPILYLSLQVICASPLPLLIDISNAPDGLQLPTCTCINQRSLTDILWSCFATIFACTWLSVHPNMPGPDEKPWKIALQRLEIMFWSIICPEMVICWACRQWFAAWRLQDKYGGLGWTKTHGYFLQMGGFMLMDGDEKKGILTIHMFRELLNEGRIAFPSITEVEIEDRSKADSLAKGIPVLQTTWFIAQCISRSVQGLITTEVELITLALAALNGILYFLWWNKPLNVKCCMPVFLLHEVCEPVMIPSYKPKSKFFYFLAEWPQISSSIFSSVHMWFLNSLGCLTGCTATGIITLAATCALPVKKALVELLKLPFKAIKVLFSRLFDLQNRNSVNEGAIQVPTFYAPRIADHGLIRVNTMIINIATVIVAMLFGGIHCIGWNFPFPSRAELIIWRMSSLIIVIVPCTIVPLIVQVFVGIQTITTTFNAFLSVFGMVIYVLAWLTLCVEALIALRHLPPGTYAVVKWTAFLPHM
ncbi:hypothetical protein K443DRAFT_97786 [Laccaria amethystina LaAM-08-1]|uniref:Uncharacterized protein n=1 Tax=Laccaria amethystina LaAM-08-1 TaxID=1095629 RepID=A0A0C9Y1S4_9AGAR|nr:hypothetical protein K443DRAFT_97786 [Laccaria amethystina LaAM-08-1]